MFRHNRRMALKDLGVAQLLRRIELAALPPLDGDVRTSPSSNMLGWILWGVLMTFILVLVVR